MTWIIILLNLVEFSWLSFAAVKFGPIYRDFGLDSSPEKEFIFNYGPLVFPFVGFIAASTLIFSEMFYKRWMRWILTILFMLLFVHVLYELLSGLIGQISVSSR